MQQPLSCAWIDLAGVIGGHLPENPEPEGVLRVLVSPIAAFRRTLSPSPTQSDGSDGLQLTGQGYTLVQVP